MSFANCVVRFALDCQFGHTFTRLSQRDATRISAISVTCTIEVVAQAVLKLAATLWEEVPMPQALAAPDIAPPLANRERALRILSKSIYRELRQNGYEPKQIVTLATELVGLVTLDIREDIREDIKEDSKLA